MKKVLRQWKRALSIFMAAVTVFTSLSLDSLIVYAADGDPDSGYVAGNAIDLVNDVLGEAINYGMVANTAQFRGHLESNFAIGTLGPINGNVNGPKAVGFIGDVIVGEFTSDISKFEYDPNGSDINTGTGTIYTTTTAKPIFFFNHSDRFVFDTSYTESELKNQVSTMVSTVNGNSKKLWEESNQNMCSVGGSIDLTNYPAGTYYFQIEDRADYKDKEEENPYFNITPGEIHINSDQMVVLNVLGSDVKLNSFKFYYNGNEVSSSNSDTAIEATDKIIFNCYEAETVTIQGGIAGVLLAPNGTVDQKDVSEGWLVANDIKVGGTEWHLLKPPTPKTPPTPGPKPEPLAFSFDKTSNVLDLSNDDVHSATFSLYEESDCSGDAIATATSRFGKVSFQFDGYTGKTYYLKETTPLAGHEADTTIYKVNVDSEGNITFGDNNATSLTVENKAITKNVDVSFVKIDSEENIKLAGVEFAIYSNADCTGDPIATATSGSYGVVTFEGLEYNEVVGGVYYIKETKTLDGYVALSGNITVNISASGQVSYTGPIAAADDGKYYVDNTTEEKGDLPSTFSFVKRDADTKEAIQGAEFTLYDSTDKPVMSATSDENGKIEFTNVSYNNKKDTTYTVKETTAAPGYFGLGADDVINVTINKKGAVSLSTTENVGGTVDNEFVVWNSSRSTNVSLSFVKVDGDNTAKKLEGAVYGLYSDVDCTSQEADATSDVNGKFSFTLAYDKADGATYYVKEKSAPAGYKLSNTVYTVTVAKDGSVKINDAAVSGDYELKDFPVQVSFSKKDVNVQGSGELQGAQIIVFADVDTPNNSASLVNATASGAVDTTKTTVTYPGGETKNVPYSISWTSGNSPMMLSGLPDGTYVMHEEVAPDKYTVATDIKFEIVNGVVTPKSDKYYSVSNDNGSNMVVMFDDLIPKKPNVIEFSKVGFDTNGAEVEGATIYVFPADKGAIGSYEVTQKADNTVVSKETNVTLTYPDGNQQAAEAIKWVSGTTSVKISGLPDGTYVMHEEAAPSGYMVATDITFKIEDEKITVVGTTSGVVDKKNGGTFFVQMNDDAKKTTVTFSKVANDKDGELEGASLILFADPTVANNSKAELAISNKSYTGKDFVNYTNLGGFERYTVKAIEWDSTTAPVSISGLTDGSYVLYETKAPQGYTTAYFIKFNIKDGVVTKISENGEIDGNKIIMTDSSTRFNIKNNIVFSKEQLGVAGEEIPGASIYVYPINDTPIFSKFGARSQDTNIVVTEVLNTTIGTSDGGSVTPTKALTWTSGTSPVIISGLPDGTYVMHEEVAPEGFVVATDIKFEIKNGKVSPVGTVTSGVVEVRKNKDNQDVNYVVMMDDVVTKTMTFSKREVSKTDELPGATLELTALTKDVDLSKLTVTGVTPKNQTTSTITWETGTSPAVIEKLPAGEYELVETGAPEGYDIATTITFTIDKSGNVIDIKSAASSSDADKGLIVMEDALTPPPSPKTKDMTFSKREVSETDELPGAELSLNALTDGVDLSKLTVTGGESGTVKQTENTITWKTGATAVEIKELPVGNYSLVEEKAPDGYEFATTITFTIDENGDVQNIVAAASSSNAETGLIVMEDELKPVTKDMTFSKREVSKTDELPGATLKLTAKTEGVDLSELTVTGVTPKEQTTSTIIWQTGTSPAVIEKLPAGNYELVETGAPDGYDIATTIKFTINDEGAVTDVEAAAEASKPSEGLIVMEDAAKTKTMTFSKREVSKTAELPGATLTLTVEGNEDADLSKLTVTGGKADTVKQSKNTITWETGDTAVEIEKLPQGNYSLVEAGAPDGYDIATTITFTIDKNGNVTNVVAAAESSDASKGLIVMEDKLTPPPSPKTKDMTFSKREVSETDELPGAELSLNALTDGVDLSGLTVTGVDTTKVTKTTTTITWFTGDAPAVIEKLPVGNYELVEKGAPDGYDVATTISFTIAKDGNVTDIKAAAKSSDASKGIIVMEDELTPVTKDMTFSKREVSKTDELPGATLELTALTKDVDLSKLTVTGVTPKDQTTSTIIWQTGTSPAVIEKLPAGKYELVETGAPDGYDIATTIKFTINDEGAVTDVEAAAEASKPSEGLIVMEDAAKTKTMTFSKREVSKTAELPGATLTLTVEGNKDADLSELTVTGGESGSVAQTKSTITWKTGTSPVVIEKLPQGNYSLVEAGAPDGYDIATTITFTIDKNGNVTNVVAAAESSDASKGLIVMEDKLTPPPSPKTKDMTFSKREVSETDELPGAELSLNALTDGVDLSGLTVTGVDTTKVTKTTTTITWFTGDTPAVIEKLPVGNYELVEKGAPDGYDIATTISFTIDKDGNVTNIEKAAKSSRAEAGLIVMEDELTPVTKDMTFSKREVSKTDELPGATLELTAKTAGVDLSELTVTGGESGSVAQTKSTITWKTGTSPVVIEKLPAGKYELVETGAPDGYDIATTIKFTINDEGAVTDVEAAAEASKPSEGLIVMEDAAKTKTMTFSKREVSETAELPNATLELTALTSGVNLSTLTVTGVDDTNVTKTASTITWKTGDTPAVIEKLPQGDYKLVETGAPKGYEIATTITFTIDINGNVINVENAAQATNADAGLIVMEDDVMPSIEFSKIGFDTNGAEVEGAKIYVYPADSTASVEDYIVKSENGPEVTKIINKTLNYPNGDTKKVDSALTWTSGTTPVVLSGLPDGTYVMHEEAAPSGYMVATDITFEIKDGKVTPVGTSTGVTSGDKNLVQMVDDALKVSFSKESSGAAGKELPGAKIVVYADPTKNAEAVTFDGVNIDSNDADAKASINAKDEYTIKGSNVTVDAISWTSGTSPVVMEGLNDGIYVMHEEVAPNGYAVATDISFEVKGGFVTVLGVDAQVLDADNYVILMVDDAVTSVAFSKKALDVAGPELSGAEVCILVDPDVKDNTASIKNLIPGAGRTVTYDSVKLNATDDIELPAAKWTSTDEPMVLGGLPDGSYIMHEVSAPSGYEVATDIKFVIENGKARATGSNSSVVVSEPSNMVTLVDDATTKVSFDKIQKGSLISIKGAELCITGYNDNVNVDLSHVYVTNGTVVNDGKKISWESQGSALEFWGLPNGDYILTELNAPKDYKITDPIIFNVNNGIIIYIGELRDDGSIVSTEEGNKILMADLYDPKPKDPSPKPGEKPNTPPSTPPNTPPSGGDTPNTPNNPPEVPPTTPEVPPTTPEVPEEPIVTPPTPPVPLVSNPPVVTTEPKKKPGNKATVTINDNKTPMAADVSKAGEVNTDNLTGDEFAHDGFLYAIFSVIAALSLIGAALIAKKKED